MCLKMRLSFSTAIKLQDMHFKHKLSTWKLLFYKKKNTGKTAKTCLYVRLEYKELFYKNIDM